jgi:hypothetical protein
MNHRKTQLLLGISALAVLFLCLSILHFADTLPPAPPQSTKEAFSILDSARYRNLSSQQKDEYVEQTFKLLEAAPEEERRELFTNNRNAVEELMTRRMDSLARKLARGEELPVFPDRPQHDPRPSDAPRNQDPNTTENRRAGAVSRMQQQVATGDPQSAALISQMRQSMSRPK